MKKIMVFLVGLAVLLATVVSCAQAPSPTPTSAPTPTSTVAPSPTSKPTQSPVATSVLAPTPKKIVLSLAAPRPETDWKTQACSRFADAVRQKTNGQVEIQIYPSGSISADKDMPDTLRFGLADLGQTDTGNFGGTIPLGTIPGLCGIWEDQYHCWRVMDGELGRMLAQELEQKSNVKFISWISNGPSDILMHRKKSIRTIDDMKGLKIRCAPGPQYIAAFEPLGASPTMISAEELYMALRQGIIDACQTSCRGGQLMKYYEPAPYLTRLLIAPDSGHALLANLDVWKGLPPDVQQIMMECGQEVQEWLRGMVYDENEVYWGKYAELEKKGIVEIYAIPESEVSLWVGQMTRGQIAFVKSKLPSQQAEKVLDIIEQTRHQ